MVARQGGAAVRSPNHLPAMPSSIGQGGSDTAAVLAHVTPTTLLTARPFLALIDALDREIMLLHSLTPRSDVPDALTTALDRLKSSVAEAATGDVWVTTDEVARITGLSRSAVTWRIRKKIIRADWRGGRWWVHRADIEVA